MNHICLFGLTFAWKTPGKDGDTEINISELIKNMNLLVLRCNKSLNNISKQDLQIPDTFVYADNKITRLSVTQEFGFLAVFYIHLPFLNNLPDNNQNQNSRISLHGMWPNFYNRHNVLENSKFSPEICFSGNHQLRTTDFGAHLKENLKEFLDKMQKDENILECDNFKNGFFNEDHLNLLQQYADNKTGSILKINFNVAHEFIKHGTCDC
jgi:hypothetical protein